MCICYMKTYTILFQKLDHARHDLAFPGVEEGPGTNPLWIPTDYCIHLSTCILYLGLK